MDVQTQVIKFYSGKTTTGKDKWDVYFADGTKATAWDYAVAAKADQAHKSGEFITASIEEKPNPNGPNPYRNLQGVTLGAVETSQQQAAQISPTALGGPQGANGGSAGRPALGSGGGMTPEDKIRVTKLSCISSAAAIFSGSGDVKTTLEASVEIFNAIWKQPEEVVAVPADPVAVTEFVNAEVGTTVVQVGIGEAAAREQEKSALPWAVA